jgi:hypothetical protein
MPDTVTEIYNDAFTGCTGITGELRIPPEVSDIGRSAFQDCTSLTGVELPEGLAGLGDRAFYGCTGIEEMTIPKSIQTLGEGCLPASLTKLTIPFVGRDREVEFSGQEEGVLRYLFGVYGGGIGQYYSQDGYTAYIDPSGLTTVILTDAAEIPSHAFSGMPQLEQVELNEGITRIGDWAFEGCTGLTGIDLPGALTDIRRNAFEGCSNLSDVHYLSAETRIFALSFDSDNEPLENASWFYTISSVLTMPESLREIEAEAFQNANIEQVLLHGDVNTVGSLAFAGNPSLRVLIIDGENTEIADDALSGSENAVVYCRAGSKAEQWCINNGVNYILK